MHFSFLARHYRQKAKESSDSEYYTCLDPLNLLEKNPYKSYHAEIHKL